VGDKPVHVNAVLAAMLPDLQTLPGSLPLSLRALSGRAGLPRRAGGGLQP
jgi:hypothetical protein